MVLSLFLSVCIVDSPKAIGRGLVCANETAMTHFRGSTLIVNVGRGLHDAPRDSKCCVSALLVVIRASVRTVYCTRYVHRCNRAAYYTLTAISNRIVMAVSNTRREPPPVCTPRYFHGEFASVMHVAAIEKRLPAIIHSRDRDSARKMVRECFAKTREIARRGNERL